MECVFFFIARINDLNDATYFLFCFCFCFLFFYLFCKCRQFLNKFFVIYIFNHDIYFSFFFNSYCNLSTVCYFLLLFNEICFVAIFLFGTSFIFLIIEKIRRNTNSGRLNLFVGCSSLCYVFINRIFNQLEHVIIIYTYTHTQPATNVGKRNNHFDYYPFVSPMPFYLYANTIRCY